MDEDYLLAKVAGLYFLKIHCSLIDRYFRTK